LGNFTDYRIHPTSTPTTMTTTPSMAEEQATEPMGNLRGGLEQDEAMGGPVVGAEEQIPQPPAPPLRIDTTYGFGADTRGVSDLSP
jgi:hypothetical protein